MCKVAVASFGVVALAWASSSPGFRVDPNQGLMDDRLAIAVTGLSAARAVTIRASSQDQQGCWWRSSVVMAVRADGSIDLALQAPVSGSYSGADAMGLFWSMRPERGPRFFAVADLYKPVVTELEAVVDGRVVAATQVIRRFAAREVSAEEVHRDGVVGVLYRPAGAGKHAAVILLGGSEGGVPAPEGAMLASRGFVTLALAYFGMGGVPPTMQLIPVEYFGGAIRLLLGLPEVQGPGVAILGGSRGAEAALLVASLYREVHAVVAASASNVRWEGASARDLPGGAAWSYQGKPLAYVPLHIGPGFALLYLWARVGRSGFSLKPMFEDSLARVRGDDAEIAVERIRGPVLLGSGDGDRKWPSSAMSRRALERLTRMQHPYADRHVSYAEAGHWLPGEYLPTGGLRGALAEEIGGTPAGTAAAQREWWPAVLSFLAAGR